MNLKKTIKLIIPPILLKLLKKFKKQKIIFNRVHINTVEENPNKQNLDLYWNPEYAKVLEEWGKDNTWNEIQLLLSTCKGKVLDIACGTGITIKILSKFNDLEIYGFDISEVLISKAIEKNIIKERLKVADATNVNYSENEFDYSYSIGSLEHFTLDGIDKFIEQSAIVTRNVSFHMIPISRSGLNEGWMTTVQSFFNNSEEWWFAKFKKHFNEVHPIPSKWEDDISFGRWFICINEV